MKMRFKILATVLAVLTLLMCVTVPIQAAVVKPDVEPMWTNTDIITLNLTFPDYGYAEATVIGKSNVTKIEIDVYVYRQSGTSWIYVAEEHSSVNKEIGIISCQFTAISNVYYRADYTFTVTKGGVEEVIEKTQYRTCP